MAIIAKRDDTSITLPIGCWDALNDMTPEQQCDLICGELAKPIMAATVRTKFSIYWHILQAWREERPDLFDEVLFSFVAEIDARNASAAGGTGSQKA